MLPFLLSSPGGYFNVTLGKERLEEALHYS